MPQSGGAINVKKAVIKKPPKPVKDPHGQNRRPDADPGSANPAGNTANRPRPAPVSNDSKEKAVDIAKDIQDKASGIGKTTDISSPNQRAQQRERRAERRQSTRQDNAERFGISSGGYSPPVSRDMAYTRPGGGGTRGGNYDHTTIAERGATDGGRLSGGFADHDLVGSHNTIDEFDGSTFAGGGGEGPAGGGGGATGSSTAGREAVGFVDYAGKSLEEAVYGVKKRRGKVSKARGE